MSRNLFRDRWLIQSVRNAMLTALSMDVLGTILSTYTPENRLKWLAGARTSYPAFNHKRRASFNTDCTVLLLSVFMNITPVQLSDLDEYRDELRRAFEQYYSAVESPNSTNPYVQLTRGVSDTGIAIPLGMIIGMYAAVALVDRTFLYSLISTTCKALGLSKEDQRDTKLYAFLAYRLSIDGYFGYSYFKELIAHNVIPAIVYKVFKDMMVHCNDEEYLVEPFDSEIDISVTERPIVQSLYYLCRVDSSFPREVLPSGPKDQLSEIFTATGVNLANVSYVYGGLCTLSEQNYSLVTKPLRENTSARKVVDEFFQYMR